MTIELIRLHFGDISFLSRSCLCSPSLSMKFRPQGATTLDLLNICYLLQQGVRMVTVTVKYCEHHSILN